jgi:uncharacterized protein YdiU (UPF0061 family)
MADIAMEGINYLSRQPDICKWNLGKLTEVWDYCLDKEKSQSIVDELYDNVYESFYYLVNSHKIGINYNSEVDKKLIDELYNLLNDFGFDLSLFFRYLSDVNDSNESINIFSEKVVKYSLAYSLLVQKKRPTVNENNLNTLLELKRSIFVLI